MKNFILLLFIVLCLASCSKSEKMDQDLCLNVSCLNGGVCIDGDCDCPSNFTGDNCEDLADACFGVTCLNGGTCIDGDCDCPNGFTGFLSNFGVSG